MDTVNHKFYVHFPNIIFLYPFTTWKIPVHSCTTSHCKVGSPRGRSCTGEEIGEVSTFLLLPMPGMVMRSEHMDIINSLRYIHLHCFQYLELWNPKDHDILNSRYICINSNTFDPDIFIKMILITCIDADCPKTSCCGTVRFIIFNDPQPDEGQ